MDRDDLIKNLFNEIQSLQSQIHVLKVSGVEGNSRRTNSPINQNGKPPVYKNPSTTKDRSITRIVPVKTQETRKTPEKPYVNQSRSQQKDVPDQNELQRKSISRSPTGSQISKRSDLYLKELKNLYDTHPETVVPEVYIYFD